MLINIGILKNLINLSGWQEDSLILGITSRGIVNIPERIKLVFHVKINLKTSSVLNCSGVDKAINPLINYLQTASFY